MASAASSLKNNKSQGNDRFNGEAANWDKNPFVKEASKRASEALLQRFPRLQDKNDGMQVLEIGCGTGLLSALVAPHSKRLVAVDAAQGMIDVLNEKLKDPQFPQNIVPVAVLLEDPEDSYLPPASEEDSSGPRQKFDLIISHLVLHHIESLKNVLTTMLGCLKSGGSIALTDFEDFGPEAKSFHPQCKMEGVERHGIRVETMENLMREVGFINVRVERAWTMEKTVERFEGEFGENGKASEGQGQVREFPFVMCIGERS
eukprot:TRINITY_DN6892_c0_g3_i1.p1 TRINITY_DN6892_c0_g3~~TRINITY_DN6892_c0_g3_i1.p1  ORF type:complete len:281 (-),score=70.48 TRINITY_DN6892_c0_g3_i1:867-1646(-)